jgi:hypothetical protein
MRTACVSVCACTIESIVLLTDGAIVHAPTSPL